MVVCSGECAEEFQVCVGHTSSHTYEFCRTELDAGQPPLSQHDCVSGCEDTAAMAALAAPPPPAGPADDRHSSPALCEAETRGHCECANLQTEQARIPGWSTYTWSTESSGDRDAV